MCRRVSMWHSGWRVGSGSRCRFELAGVTHHLNEQVTCLNLRFLTKQAQGRDCGGCR